MGGIYTRYRGCHRIGACFNSTGESGCPTPQSRKDHLYSYSRGRPGRKIGEGGCAAAFGTGKAGFAAEKNLMGRSLKAQMKFAGRLGASYVVIFGLEEIKQGRLVLRDMLKGEQLELPRNGLVEYLKSLLN